MVITLHTLIHLVLTRNMGALQIKGLKVKKVSLWLKTTQLKFESRSAILQSLPSKYGPARYIQSFRMRVP